jgi:hypothetical protein
MIISCSLPEVVSVEYLGYNEQYAWLTGEWMSPLRDEFEPSKDAKERAFVLGFELVGRYEPDCNFYGLSRYFLL